MADLTTQIDISADASGVESGVGRAKRSLSELGRSAGAAGQQAGRGMGAIGDGSARAAQQLDRNTTSMVRSIQRQIAAAEAGGSNTAAYYREIANQRGLKLDVLDPYLRQLDEVAAKQRGGGVEMAAMETKARALGMSVGELRAATRGLPAQFTDIAVSLQGGQRPMTVLLQQGGQLKDMFGGIGPAARAMGGYVMGLVNPYTLAAGAVLGLGAAYYSGWQQSREMERAVVSSGNAIGLSAGQVQALTDRLGAATGRYGEARAAALAMVSAGTSSGEQLSIVMQGVLDGVSVTGQEVDDLADIFADLRKDPVDAILKLNSEQRFLTQAVFETIQSLQEQGKATEAANLAQRTYAETLASRKDEINRNIGTIESAWNGVKRAIAGAMNAMSSIGTEADAIAVLDKAVADGERALRARETILAGLKASNLEADQSEIAAYNREKARVQSLKDERTILVSRNEAQAEGNRIQEAGVKATAAVGEVYKDARSNTEKLNFALAEFRKNIEAIRASNPESALLDPKKIAAAEKAIREAHADKKTGGGGAAGESRVAAIRAQIEAEQMLSAALAEKSRAILAGGTATAKILPSEQQLLTVTQRLKTATDAKTRANLLEQKAELERLVPLARANEAEQERIKLQEDFERVRERGIEAQVREIDALTQKAIQTEQEVAAYGMGKAAVEALTIARLQEQAAVLAGFPGSEAEVERINKEIAARERLATATAEREVLDANKKAAEDATRAWDRAAGQAGQSLTDAIFDGGMSAKQLVERLFKTMVLRPLLEPALQGGMGAVGSLLGIPGAPGVAGGGQNLGSLVSLANNAGKVWTGISSALGFGSAAAAGSTAAAGAGLGITGSMLGTGASTGIGLGINGAAAGLGLQAGGATLATTAGTSAAAASGAAAGAGGALGAIGAAAPYAAMALAAYSLLSGSFKGETRSGAQYGLALNDELYNPRRGTTVASANGVQFLEGPSGGGASSDVQKAIQLTTEGINSLFKTIGADISLSAFWAGFEGSEKGRGGVGAGGMLSSGFSFGEQGTGDNYKGNLYDPNRPGSLSADDALKLLPAQLAQASLQAWQTASDLMPGMIRRKLEGVDLAGLSDEKLIELRDEFVLTVAQAEELRIGLSILPFAPAAAQTLTFSSALIEYTGSAEEATNLIANAYQNYWSEAERVGHVTEVVTQGFSDLGLEVPRTRAEMQALLTANMALGEGGAKTTAKLLEMGDGLDAVLAVSEAIANERLGLESQILKLQGDTVELRRRELQALDPANRSLQELIWQLEGAAAVADERLGLEGRLLDLQGDTTELRRRELAALDPANRAIQERIWFLEDEKVASDAAKAASDEMRDLRTTFDDLVDPAGALGRQNRDLTDRFAALGHLMPTTLADYASLVDLTRDAGDAHADTYRELLRLAPEFGAYIEGVKGTADALKESARTFAQAQKTAKDAIASSFDGLRNQIILDQLETPQRQYDSYKSQADALAELMPTLTTPEAQAQAAQQWRDLATSAYNLLDAEGKRTQGVEYLQAIDSMQGKVFDSIDRLNKDTTDKQIKAWEAAQERAAKQMAAEFGRAIRTAMKDGSEPLRDAAEIIESAAAMFESGTIRTGRPVQQEEVTS